MSDDQDRLAEPAEDRPQSEPEDLQELIEALTKFDSPAPTYSFHY